MPKTKKVGRTGRFGARYGSTLRKRIKKIEDVQKTPSRCPSCFTIAVRRTSVGIWRCKKCGYTFTGGAWEPITQRGKGLWQSKSQVHES
ncbi:MAG: 50S ribosomal protein L37ae [Candidatus Ranarchaeia archaeon]